MMPPSVGEEGGKLADQVGGASGERTWQRLLAGAVREVDELWRLLDLPHEGLPGARLAVRGFPLLVPRGYLARMRRGDPGDPLLRQILPQGDESMVAAGYGMDPLGEAGSEVVPGLLHKYRSRALLVTTGVCAVHCRYCFRRHFPYDALPRGIARWQPALDWLATHPEVDEVILSGGDPLILSDHTLSGLAQALASIPHLARLRVHTRLPVVLPERIDPALIAWLTGTRLTPVVVVHANHARDLAPDSANACRRLLTAGVVMLNQAVLLAGVNDSVSDLAALSRSCALAGVVPYYLHVLDRVQGAAHFACPDEQARELLRRLAGELPGYLVPRLVREEQGAAAKVRLM